MKNRCRILLVLLFLNFFIAQCYAEAPAQTAKKFANVLEKLKVKYEFDYKPNQDFQSVNVQFYGKNVNTIKIDCLFTSVEPFEFVRFIVPNLLKIPKQDQCKVYQLINTLNEKTSYVKFYYDDDMHCVSAVIDITIPPNTKFEDACSCYFGALKTIVDTCDEVYPDLAQLAWN